MRRLAPAMLALVIVLIGCAGGRVGVGVGVSTGYWGPPVSAYGLNYWYGGPMFYGGWGPGYYVGPPVRGGSRGWGGLRGGRRTAFRPAPAARPMPSIPSRARGSPRRR
jgi:hypothetical protein